MNSLAAAYGDAHGVADWSKVAEVGLTVPELLRHCATFPERELIVSDDGRITYGEAIRQSAMLARQLLEAGVGKGSRVGMIFPNGARYVVAWLAITRIGAVATPISTLATGPEISRIIRHADLCLLICADRILHHDLLARVGELCDGAEKAGGRLMLERAPFLRQVWVWGEASAPWAETVDLARAALVGDAILAAAEAEVSPADPVSIIYTSGSTAEPKGVIHSHGGFMRQGVKLSATYPFLPGDRVFTQMPMFWVGGLTVTLLNCMISGATILGTGQTGSAMLDFIERERVSFAFGWSHIMRAIGADPSLAGRDFSAMRGGALVAALPPEKRPKNQSFASALGMTETSGPHTVSLPDLPDDLVGSYGPPMPGMEHRIVDVDTGRDLDELSIGELWVRGDALMQGMVKRERQDVFQADGWYRTGDLCSFKQGHLFFHGRLDDLIKTSGANVSPREVEQAYSGLAGVTQVLALGLPDPARGAVVGLVLVVGAGSSISEDKLRAAASQLASYKRPKVQAVLEASQMPMASSGKADRRALIALLQEKRAYDGGA